MISQATDRPEHSRGQRFTLFVDDVEFQVDRDTLTAGEIMDLAGIPRDVGLVLIEEDGSQRTLQIGEEIELRPGRRFKKAPRFRRG